MKILLVSPLPPPEGGIASWTKMLLSNWPSGIELVHFDSAVKTSKSYPGFWGRVFRAIKKIPYELWKIYSLAKKNDVDICHVTTSGHLGFMRDVLIALLMRVIGKKTIFHMRFGRIPELCKVRNWESFLLSRLFGCCDGMIAIDLATFSALTEKFGSEKIFYIPNFVDMKQFPTESALGEERIGGRLFFSGHIVEEKGMRELFEACNGLPGAQLVLAGKCTETFKAELLNTYTEVSYEFLGIVSREEIIKQLQMCNVFVFPSYTEGFPNSVAEAMVCGCAIVATPVGAIPEMLNADSADEPCGILVDVKAPLQLRAAIERLLGDNNLCRTLGCRARKRVEHEYGEIIVVNKLVTVWESLLDNSCVSIK